MKIPRSSNSQIKLLLLSRTHFLGIAYALAWLILNFFRLRFPFGLSGWAYLYTRGRSLGTVLFYSGLNAAEVSALTFVEKLHLVSKKR
jgi:hypothetical protein